MPMIDRILLGADGSDVSRHAEQTTLRLARATDAEARAVHVLQRPSLYAAGPGFDPRILEARRETGEQVLGQVRERAVEADVSVTTELVEGRPAEQLLAQADAWDADLLAVGTRGYGTLERAIVGSVADQLVRTSPVPVLTVSQASDEPPPSPIERILLPSDGSKASLAAAPFALELARATGAELVLVHAITPELEGGKYLDRPASAVAEVHDELADEALDPLAERCRRADVPHERRVVHAPAAEAIVDEAEERDADLIVMATHGRSGIQRFLVGSVADKVLRTASTPLVTVRPGEEG